MYMWFLKLIFFLFPPTPWVHIATGKKTSQELHCGTARRICHADYLQVAAWAWGAPLACARGSACYLILFEAAPQHLTLHLATACMLTVKRGQCRLKRAVKVDFIFAFGYKLARIEQEQDCKGSWWGRMHRGAVRIVVKLHFGAIFTNCLHPNFTFRKCTIGQVGRSRNKDKKDDRTSADLQLNFIVKKYVTTGI